jgi:hypothetical protein
LSSERARIASTLGECSIEHPPRLLAPRQGGDEAQVVESDRAGLATHDQSLENVRVQPSEAQEAADITVGQAIIVLVSAPTDSAPSASASKLPRIVLQPAEALSRAPSAVNNM